MGFHTDADVPVPAVTAAQMREIDRIAVSDFGLTILQMMENAGRSLALNVMDMLGAPTASPGPDRTREVVILAGSGGNGGGGLCCARHLHNRGFSVYRMSSIRVVLSKEPETLAGAAQNQYHILHAAGVHPVPLAQAAGVIRRACLVVDALIGYSLRGAPRGTVAELIDLCNQHAARVLSLDIPSGLDATTGETPGPVVRPERTLTLALPKTGLQRAPGDLYLADIGIPMGVYQRIGITFEPPFGRRYWIPLRVSKGA